MNTNLIKFTATLLLCIAGALAANAQSDTLKVRMMTYNLRFGELATLEEIGAHIKSFNPDFVALEEVDINPKRNLAPHQFGKNFVTELSKATGMFGVFAKAINLGEKGYYGNALLTKYPVIKSETMLLPNPRSTEQRVLLCTWLDMGKGDTIVVAATHLCYKHEETKYEQAGAIIKKLEETGGYPILLGGDFNTNPKSITYNRFIQSGWLEDTGFAPTWPTWAPKQKLDFIFAYPAKKWRVLKAWDIPSCLSDHLPVVADLEYIR